MGSLPEKTKAREDINDNGIDRIGRLPDEILHYILSLSDLQIFDVGNLSVLSKRWYHLCTTTPYLHLELDEFCDSRGDALRNIALYERLRNFMNWVLISRQDSPILRFRLFSSNAYDKLQVFRWLCAAAKRNVKELEIEFQPVGVFNLPLSIAASDSLELVHICLGYQVMQLPNHTTLKRLRRLVLKEVEFRDTRSLERLISGCCVLEDLSMDDCMGTNFASLHISSSCIKQLSLCFSEDAYVCNSEITISCPSLTSFVYLAPFPKSFILLNAPRIEYAQIGLMMDGAIPKVGPVMYNILKSVCNVTTLCLIHLLVPCLHYAIDEMLCCPIIFHKVSSLTLDLSLVGAHTQVMFLLIDRCPNLEALSLVCSKWHNPEWDEKWQLDHEGNVSWISHPHLKTIELSHFNGYMYDLDFLKFLLKNASTLEKLNIIWDREETCPSIINTVLDFPRASPNCTVKFCCPDI